MESSLLALTVAAYLVAGFAWPVLRLWLHCGIWPVVFHREAAPMQRGLGFLFVALFLGMLVLGVLHVAVGANALGLWHPPAAARFGGWLLLASGAVVTLVAQRHMGASWRVGIDDRPTDLVTTGLFRHVRNPIFAGMLAFVAGVVILSPAWWSIAIGILTALGVRLQVAYEERHLIALHDRAYLAYAARAGRVVPFVGRLRTAPRLRSARGSVAAIPEVKS